MPVAISLFLGKAANLMGGVAVQCGWRVDSIVPHLYLICLVSGRVEGNERHGAQHLHGGHGQPALFIHTVNCAFIPPLNHEVILPIVCAHWPVNMFHLQVSVTLKSETVFEIAGSTRPWIGSSTPCLALSPKRSVL